MNPNLDLPKLEYAETHPHLFQLAETFIELQRRVPILFESYIAPYNLNYFAWNALALIEPLGDQATLTAIGEAMHASPSTMTGIATRLVQAGLVRRIASPRDRRASILQLTERGEEITNAVLNRFFGDLSRVADEIGQDTIEQVAASFRQIHAIFDMMEQERHDTEPMPSE